MRAEFDSQIGVHEDHSQTGDAAVQQRLQLRLQRAEVRTPYHQQLLT